METIEIKVPASDRAALISFYRKRLESKLEEVEAIKKLLIDLDRITEKIIIRPSSKNFIFSEKNRVDGVYDPSWTWRTKILYVLQKGDLTTNEIVEKIIELEAEKNLDRGSVLSSVSSTLSVMSRSDDSLLERRTSPSGKELMFRINKQSIDKLQTIQPASR